MSRGSTTGDPIGAGGSHPIPDAALDADIAILGKKGRGKTYTAKGCVERLLDLGRRVIVLDPNSTWWGLKAGPHGYPIAVLGGPQGDLPLSDADGASLGRYLATAAQSAVLDLGAMRKAEMIRFVTPFLEELYTHNREPLTLVLEEADVFAPQQPMADNARLLGEVDRIARRGRQFGFRLISLTQRPAKLNKDVLTQLSTLVALGITSPQDRDAIKAWVEGNADRDKAKEVVDSLASLKVGEGWVWAPDLDLLERVVFPPIRTLDTSATPKAGVARPAIALRKDVDVAALREVLGADATEGSGARAGRAAPDGAVAAAEEHGYERGYGEGYADRKAEERRAVRAKLARVADVLGDLAANPWAFDEVDDDGIAAMFAPGRSADAGGGELSPAEAPDATPAGRTAPGPLTAGEARLVAALEANDPAPVPWAAVAIRAGYVASGGGFLRAKKALIGRGLVTESGAGVVLRQVTSPKSIPSEAALVDQWSRRLGTGPAKLLHAVSKAGGSVSRTGLAGMTGYVASGGGFLRAAKQLRTAGLVEQSHHTFRYTAAFRRACGLLKSEGGRA